MHEIIGKLKEWDWKEFAERFPEAAEFLKSRAMYRRWLELSIQRTRATAVGELAWIDTQMKELEPYLKWSPLSTENNDRLQGKGE